MAARVVSGRFVPSCPSCVLDRVGPCPVGSLPCWIVAVRVAACLVRVEASRSVPCCVVACWWSVRCRVAHGSEKKLKNRTLLGHLKSLWFFVEVLLHQPALKHVFFILELLTEVDQAFLTWIFIFPVPVSLLMIVRPLGFSFSFQN